MSKLFLMAGTKGGIGKTLVATLLADISADAGYRSVLFDCDEENKSLFHAMSGRKVDQILERYSLEAEFGNDNFPLDRVLNRLFEIEQNKEHYPGENVFVIDLKAGSTCKMLEWMKLCFITRQRKKNGRRCQKSRFIWKMEQNMIIFTIFAGFLRYAKQIFMGIYTVMIVPCRRQQIFMQADKQLWIKK